MFLGQVNGQDTLTDKNCGFVQDIWMSLDDFRGDTDELRAARMRALRLAVSPKAGIGDNQDQFAKWLGLAGRSTWNNYEQGKPLSRRFANLVSAKTAIPYGWIQTGDPRGMDYEIKERLEFALLYPEEALNRLRFGPDASTAPAVEAPPPAARRR